MVNKVPKAAVGVSALTAASITFTSYENNEPYRNKQLMHTDQTLIYPYRTPWESSPNQSSTSNDSSGAAKLMIVLLVDVYEL